MPPVDKSRCDDDVSVASPPLTKQRARQLYLQSKGLCLICGRGACTDSKVRCRRCKRRDAILAAARKRMGEDWTPLYKRKRPVLRPRKRPTRKWKERVKRKPKPKIKRPSTKKQEVVERLTEAEADRRTIELHNMAMVIRAGEMERVAKLIRAELNNATPKQQVAIVNPDQTTKSNSTSITATESSS